MGQQAKVYRVKSGKLFFAMKVIECPCVALPSFELEHYEKEFSILSSIKHPNIIQYFRKFINEQDRLSLIMEYALNGDYETLVKKRFGTH